MFLQVIICYICILLVMVDAAFDFSILDHLPQLEDMNHTSISIHIDLADEDLYGIKEFCQTTTFKTEFALRNDCSDKLLRIMTGITAGQNASISKYIKDPCLTYMVLLEQEHDLNDLLSKRIRNQAYIFALLESQNKTLELYEIQYYSQRIVHLATWKKNDMPELTVAQSIAERRADFAGSAVRFVQSVYLDFDGRETAEVMKSIKSKHNITLIKMPFEGYGTLLPNGSWNGAIRQILENEIDVGSLRMTLTKNRREVAQPGYILDEEIIVAIFNSRLQSGSFAWNLIINIFDKQVYLVLITFNLINSFFLATSSKTLRFVKHWLLAFAFTFKAFFGDSFNEGLFLKPEFRNSKKLQMFCASFLGIFLYWCWTGILTSILAVPIVEVPIRSLNDLNNKKDLTLMSYDGGNLASYIYKWTKESTTNAATFERSILLVGDEQEITEETLKGRNIVRLNSDVELSWIYKEYEASGLNLCDFDEVELPEFGKYQISWMYPENSILQPIFDEYFHQLVESGIMKKNNDNIERFCQSNGIAPVDFGFTTLNFMIIIAGTLTSIFILCAELALQKYKLRFVHFQDRH